MRRLCLGVQANRADRAALAKRWSADRWKVLHKKRSSALQTRRLIIAPAAFGDGCQAARRALKYEASG